jgi:large subunit ribosomal protein L13
MTALTEGILDRGNRAMRTIMAKKETVERKWFVIDGTNQVVGRLAVQIANILRGKHRPDYTPHCDNGDFVIVVNAEKVQFTGKKWDTQTYSSYSHYPGGLKVVGAKEILKRRPTMILEMAVKRMVPRNRLGRQQMTKLKLYAGPAHPHQAQQPVELKLPTK